MRNRQNVRINIQSAPKDLNDAETNLELALDRIHNCFHIGEFVTIIRSVFNKKVRLFNAA